ncbi:hypothetical protein [Taibaiella chishuiensis]|uniref:Uncharacterized protein n=1 Tax=Taibaiella chishuiensis TaxID=1434707 RepID=A0A2P8D386_9BACT|nr:hypothetical protein [Taibaiella chishuiensis]PSK91636.1 hypothetical protein B0I18_105221 [Taibaiella chishuiensis]
MEQPDHIQVNEKYLEDYWRTMIKGDETVDFYRAQLRFIDAFKNELSITGADGLYLKKDIWNVSLNPDALQNFVTIPTIVGILDYIGCTQLAATVIPIVFQGLFKVQNFKISLKDEKIFLSLPLMDDNVYKSAEQLYKSLPKATRKKISEFDFFDTIENFVKAGLAQEKDGKYLILEKNQTKVQFSFMPR